jgi:hypothetical protein
MKYGPPGMKTAPSGHCIAGVALVLAIGVIEDADAEGAGAVFDPLRK